MESEADPVINPDLQVRLLDKQKQDMRFETWSEIKYWGIWVAVVCAVGAGGYGILTYVNSEKKIALDEARLSCEYIEKRCDGGFVEPRLEPDAIRCYCVMKPVEVVSPIIK